MTAPHSISSGRAALLPCPFCGSPANLTHFRSGAANITQIQCDNDDKCAVCVDIKHVNEAVAVEAWNTRAPVLPSGEGEIEAVRQKMTRLKETECRHSGQLSEALLYGLHRAVEKYLMAISPHPPPPTPPFSRWADTIEAASLAISPKGSKELDALAAEVRAGGVALISRLRGMPSSLNDACRTMEEAADVLCGGVAQAAPEPEAYRETVRRVAAVREKRMAEMREALERIRNFPHDKTACEQAMSQIAGEALAIPSTDREGEK